MNIKHSSDFHCNSKEKMYCRVMCYIKNFRYIFAVRKLKVPIFKNEFSLHFSV